MNHFSHFLAGLLLFGSTLFTACTTPAIDAPTDIINNPPVPPIQDPGATAPCENGIISFHHQILPIMVSSCAYSGCHDSQTAEDGVVLETYEDVRREVKPGNPNDSELFKSISESGDDDIMPPLPSSPLNTIQIELIRNWILQGANNTDCGAPCDSTAFTFSATIFPLLQDACVGCHNTIRADGNVQLDTYQEILPWVENGALLKSIRHEEFYPPMPPSGSQLSDCRIQQIEQWIEAGALNN